MTKTAVILINTGTPASAETRHVRRYLREFLGDGRVITLPWLGRKLLVNGIITPFRAPKSAKLYKAIWTEQGSPLLFLTQSFAEKLQKELGEAYFVIIGMRYGKPSLKEAIELAIKEKYDRIVLFPMFPQYASSTTGSALELAFSMLRKENAIPGVAAIHQFYDHPGFIKAYAHQISLENPSGYDHLLFSFHSLPLSHLRAIHNGQDCAAFDCTNQINDQNAFCYHATCYATARLIAAELKISPDRYSVCFQSRFSKNWLGPFAEDVIRHKAQKGIRKMLVASPAFVTDCLETIEEIGKTYHDLFLENGGEKFTLVNSLNDSDLWVQTAAAIIKKGI